mgnify:CR=1 FL=1
MVLALLIIIFVIIAFVLWCVVRAASLYDRMVDDAEQEKFVKEYEQSPSQ